MMKFPGHQMLQFCRAFARDRCSNALVSTCLPRAARQAMSAATAGEANPALAQNFTQDALSDSPKRQVLYDAVLNSPDDGRRWRYRAGRRILPAAVHAARAWTALQVSVRAYSRSRARLMRFLATHPEAVVLIDNQQALNFKLDVTGSSLWGKNIRRRFSFRHFQQGLARFGRCVETGDHFMLYRPVG